VKQDAKETVGGGKLKTHPHKEPVHFDWNSWRTMPVEIATSKFAGDEHAATGRPVLARSNHT